MRIKKILLTIPLLFLCNSCSLQGGGGSKTIYDVQFVLVTAGNVLNTNIYGPDKGPVGFISYKSFFASCYVKVDYDSNITFSCTFSDGSNFSRIGKYTAGVAESGNILAAVYSDGWQVSYYWPSYYQFYSTEIFDLPALGPTSVTILYQATVIFG
jgi:hypothetical protein